MHCVQVLVHLHSGSARLAKPVADTAGCATYTAQARRDQAAGRLLLAPAASEFIGASATFWALLDCEYAIGVTAPHGDVVPESVACYNAWMTRAIEARHGAHFLRRLAAESDSLDASGLGFTPPVARGRVSAQEAINRDFAYRIELDAHPGRAILVTVTVDCAGRASELRAVWTTHYWNGALGMVPLPPTHRYYRPAAQAVHALRWKPATLRGRPVSATVQVLFRTGYVPKLGKS